MFCLRENEYRSIARNIHYGAVYIFDHDLRFVIAEGQAMEILNLTREDLESKTIWEAVDEETCQIIEKRYRRVLSGESFHTETLLKNRTFSSNYIPIRDIHNKVFAGMVMSHDITERKCAKEKLEKQAVQLERLASQLTLSEQRERQRIADVLHDDLQQLLIAAKMRCQNIFPRLREDVQHAAEEILELFNQSIQTTRSLTAEISPPALQYGNFYDALEWLVDWMHAAPPARETGR